MSKIANSIKSKINRLYFKENKTIPQISEKLNLPYKTVLDSIKRGDFYKFRAAPKSVKNNKNAVLIISDTVSEYFGLRDGIINKKTRLKEILIPRQISHTISYNLTKSSNAFIGSLIGQMDHATVSHSRSIINNFLSYKNDVRDSYLEIEKICYERIKEYK